MKISIQTLGCKVNQSESASIAGNLVNNNYEIVKHVDDSDICIINTCTVTAKSDYQSRQLIRKAARAGARVIVTGCYAQLEPDDLANIDGVTHVIGNAGKSEISDIIVGLNGSSDNQKIKVTVPDFPLYKQPYHSTRSRAFLKMQDGCNLSCSYCAVNKARGMSRSLAVENVISSSLRLVADGYKEIVLTGVHIGSFGQDLNPKSKLSSVVDRLSRDCPETRFRISSLEPSEIESDLMSLLKRDNICNHLHIPLQSGSDKILRFMNRGYSISSFEQVINNIVREYPHIAIGTDVIVGFPGETDEDFNQTMNFIDIMPFSYLHVFPYSRRPDTPANAMDGQVEDTIKRERVKSLIEISKYKKYDYLKRNVGSILNVIVEKRDSNHYYYKAISDNYLHIMVRGDGIRPGQRLNVEVKSMDGSYLIAQALD